MNVLGLSFDYHDSSAALVKEGVLVAAASEERFSRIKHDSGLPKLAVEFALNKGGITMDECIRNLMNDRNHPDLFLEVDEDDLTEKILTLLRRLSKDAEQIGHEIVEARRQAFASIPTPPGHA